MKRYGPTPQRRPEPPVLAVEGQGTHPGKRGGNLPRMRKSVLVVLCALANSPAAAKDTGLIFVSNEKTNNIVVMDPASYKIVKGLTSTDSRQPWRWKPKALTSRSKVTVSSDAP